MKDLTLTRRGEIVVGVLQFIGTCLALGLFIVSVPLFLWALIP